MKQPSKRYVYSVNRDFSRTHGHDEVLGIFYQMEDAISHAKKVRDKAKEDEWDNTIFRIYRQQILLSEDYIIFEHDELEMEQVEVPIEELMEILE